VYMQVDVPMAQPPVANWLLMAATVVFSIAGFVQDSKHSRYTLDLDDPAEVQLDPAVERQLSDPQLTQQQKMEILRRELAKARGRGSDESTELQGTLKYALHPPRSGHFHVWQLITYQFVHADFMHLLGNMIFLFCFGNAVNAKIGQLLFVPLYLVLGVVAGIGWLVLGSNNPLVGASGAIMGITGVFLVLYPLNEIAVWTFRSFLYTGDAWRFPSWVFIAFYMVLDLLGSTLDRATGGGGVAYVCHIAGEFVGFGVGCLLVATRWVRSDRGEQNLLEAMGWLEEERPRRRKRRRPKPPPPTSYP
jgi:membrane associated rhomboid family serine protease